MSAIVSVAWRVTGDQSVRLGVVTIALVNGCALVVAAFALVEAGRRVGSRLPLPDGTGTRSPEDDVPPRLVSLVPMGVGVVAGALLVFVAAGITEPFLTNGYADPIWSLAAVGAVAYGLQVSSGPGPASDQGVAVVLILVAGLSKNEGFIVAVFLIALVALRALLAPPGAERRRWRRPVAVGAVELALVAAWPVLMRIIHARGESTSVSPAGDWPSRARAAFDGMAPYLHVLVLAAPVAVVGGLVLSGTRRRSGVANDLWAWCGVAIGLVAVGGALAVGTGAIAPWLETTVHRVTEFSALAGWWIIALWAVVAAGAVVEATGGHHRSNGAGSEPAAGVTSPDGGTRVPVPTAAR